MSPGHHNNMPSKSIKEVPGRSKLRVESINPVPTGNPKPKTSKVKLILPEEAIKLSSGGTQWAPSPISDAPRPKPPPATSQLPKPVLPQQTTVTPTPVSLHRTFEPPKPVLPHQTPVTPKPVLAHQAPQLPRPASGLSARSTLEAPRPVLVCPISEPPRPVSARSAFFGRELVCGLRALSLTTQTPRQRKNNPSPLQAKTVEPPPSPRALKIRSRVKQQAANATQVVQGTTVEVGAGDTVRDHGSKRLRQSISDPQLTELLEYRPALISTWKGRIVDSATPPEFDCEFWGKPASYIRRKAEKLLNMMPALLNVELIPTGHILDDVFGRIPSLSSVELYLFPDEKITERFNGARLFAAMATRNAMIKVPINGTELLIFSSRLLDETSQFLINTQEKTEDFLWGFFPRTKKPVALVPGTCYQTEKDLNDGDVVDMDVGTKYVIPPSLASRLIPEPESTPSRSPEMVNSEASLPPGFEKIWTPPLVKLSIQGTSNPKSEVNGLAGLVRNQSGKWVFGYSRCHKCPCEVSAGLLAIFEGLSLLWDSGFRKIRVETTSLEIVDALATKTNLFPKTRSILDLCKDMILKDWECDIYHIPKEENSCAEWLASKVEETPQGLVFFELPPRGLVGRLEQEYIAA